MSDKQFAVIHWHGYQCNKDNKPVMSFAKHEDFTEDMGWHEEDLKEINDLHVNGKYDTGGPIEEVTVYRWK